ncbi:MAG: nucleotidyl transferase AbiEii/AbiGii toxin family protein [Cyclobacteriaceae bacterium]|nr:nucleotidyl transferase AbiEii/AbiGii toxin family protein [Cyclobacteriaceae bacterium]
MPERKFYNNLYAVQDDLMEMVQEQKVDFYLTGGTALSRCYLNHRYSDDLDFFVNEAPDFKKQTERVVSAIRKAGMQIELGTASESFLRITVLKDEVSLKIDFVNDVIYHYGDFEAAHFFNKIDSWRNILSNKLCAVSRLEPKDIADLLFIAKKFAFEWPDIMEEAKNKDLWVEPLNVSRIIKEFPVDLFDSVKWITPVAKKKLSKELHRMHDDIFYGHSNSLAEY